MVVRSRTARNEEIGLGTRSAAAEAQVNKIYDELAKVDSGNKKLGVGANANRHSADFEAKISSHMADLESSDAEWRVHKTVEERLTPAAKMWGLGTKPLKKELTRLMKEMDDALHDLTSAYDSVLKKPLKQLEDLTGEANKNRVTGHEKFGSTRLGEMMGLSGGKVGDGVVFNEERLLELMVKARAGIAAVKVLGRVLDKIKDGRDGEAGTLLKNAAGISKESGAAQALKDFIPHFDELKEPKVKTKPKATSKTADFALKIEVKEMENLAKGVNEKVDEARQNKSAAALLEMNTLTTTLWILARKQMENSGPETADKIMAILKGVNENVFSLEKSGIRIEMMNNDDWEKLYSGVDRNSGKIINKPIEQLNSTFLQDMTGTYGLEKKYHFDANEVLVQLRSYFRDRGQSLKPGGNAVSSDLSPPGLSA